MTLADLLFQPGFVARLVLRFSNALEAMATAPAGSPDSQVQFLDFGEVDGVPHKTVLQVTSADPRVMARLQRAVENED